MACCLPTAGARAWEWCRGLPGRPAVHLQPVGLPSLSCLIVSIVVRALSPLLSTTAPRGSRIPVSQMGKLRLTEVSRGHSQVLGL